MGWLTGWNYRKAITISNTGSSLTNYQVLITVDTASLVTASKLLSSCNDIRFTSSDGSTNLNYWIESGCNTSSTKIWVKIPSISSGSTIIYLYYNNTGASVASNGTNTFDFFEDFSTDVFVDTTNWTKSNSVVSVTTGNLQIASGGGYNQYAERINLSIPTPFIYQCRHTETSALGYAYSYDYLISGSTRLFGNARDTSNNWYVYEGATLRSTFNNSIGGTNNWIQKKYVLTSSTGISTAKLDTDVSFTTIGTSTWTGSFSSVTKLHWEQPYDNISKWDWVLIRKYTATEPTTCIGGEEVSTVLWLTGWNRRRKLTITGSTAGAQIDYQIKLTVHKATGTDTSTDIYLGTNVKDDFSDLRFTLNDGSTNLNYWIESYTSGSVTTVWIKIPSIPISPCTTTIYVYYNNTGASTTSNGDNTFDFFDDFPGTSLDGSKWGSAIAYNSGTATRTVSGSVLTYASTNTGGNGIPSIYSVPSTGNFTVRTKINSLTVSGSNGQVRIVTANNTVLDPGATNGIYHGSSTSMFLYVNSVSGSYTLGGFASPKIFEWTISNNGKLYEDGIQKVSLTNTNPTLTSQYLRIWVYYNDSVALDWILVHKYVATEPTTCIGGEEVSTVSWLTGWNRRKLLTITGSTAGTQTNYQIRLVVHKATGTDTSTDIYLGTNVNNDFSDLRFTSSNGSTLLSYWIESYTSGSVATVWAKIPSVPTSPCTTTTYIYYNNTGASTTSNHDNVFIYATGGTVSYSGNYTIHTFLTGGTLITNNSMNVEYLVVGGGGTGGGWGYGGGGGGAGGFRTGTGFAVTPQTYSITVGAGGNSIGASGGNSIFSTITSIGGGSGGYYTGAYGAAGYTWIASTSGGSGGGGASGGNDCSTGAAAGTAGQGNNGGKGYCGSGYNYIWGGGGGASSVGGDATSNGPPGNGGSGSSSSISGSLSYYAGGGGGSTGYLSLFGTGGTGGGGAASTTGTDGTANTGGGGGAASNHSSSSQFGHGGSGIVIIRYINRTIASPEPTFSTIDTEETLTCNAPSANLVVLEIVSNQLLRQYPSYIDLEAISKLLDSYIKH
jgi:hypothetical protein